MVKGGLKAIYCSGWQVAADANAAGQVCPVLVCIALALWTFAPARHACQAAKQQTQQHMGL